LVLIGEEAFFLTQNHPNHWFFSFQNMTGLLYLSLIILPEFFMLAYEKLSGNNDFIYNHILGSQICEIFGKTLESSDFF